MMSMLPGFTPRFVSHGLLRLLSRRIADPFIKRLASSKLNQREWLMKRLWLGRDTTFGRDHGFASMRTLNDFRRQVPVAGYDYFAPYISGVAAGNTRMLIPDCEKVLQFTITTGSSGIPKLNPVTSTWLKEYRNAWNVWGLRLFVDHPEKIGSRMLQMAGSSDMGKTSGGYQISMVSALLSGIQNPLLKPYYLIPPVVNLIPDPVARHYVALRLSIMHDVGWILLMNPGTLIRLAEIGNHYSDTLLRDVSDGTLTRDLEIPEDIRNSLQRKYLTRDPAGAGRIAAMASQTGRLLPVDYWNSPVIGCWLAGTAGYQSRYLPEYFGASPCRDMGLVSSEGRHTIPLHDHTTAGVPSVESGFYEFVPAEESDGDHSEALEGHELLPGKQYRLIMTTSAGYYRFDIGDIVKCCGFIGEAPLLAFVQKSGRVGDLEGEKLTEDQVVESAQTAAACADVSLRLITAVPRRPENQQPHYDFLIEYTDMPDQEKAMNFLMNLDSELQRMNFLWRARRREGVLQPPRLKRLASGEWDRFILQETGRRGTGDYQYKHPCLVTDERWLRQFEVQDTITF